MEQKKKEISKDELKIAQEKKEREKREILAKADEVKNQTFELELDGTISLKKEIEDLPIEPIDNPEEKYESYHLVLNRLLRKYLPKGKEHKSARDLIYEEKNTFLTRGHRKDEKGIRGADGKMSYVADIHELINIVADWAATHGTMFELYNKLRETNIKKGYGDPLVKK